MVPVAIATGTATGTIRNDDAPGLSVADASGSESAGRLVFTVTLDHASAEEVTVEYTTSDDTVGPNPATAGTDYTAITTAQTLTFAANVTSMDIVVTVANDSAIEPDETFILTLANPNGATIATGTATGTIRNDDAPGLSVADASGSESAGRLVFTVTLEPASDQQVTVEYTTSDDTVGPNPATAGTDYTAITTAQTLTFAANVTSMDIVVTVADDSRDRARRDLHPDTRQPQRGNHRHRHRHRHHPQRRPSRSTALVRWRRRVTTKAHRSERYCHHDAQGSADRSGVPGPGAGARQPADHG